MKRQESGLKAIRHIQDRINDFLADGSHGLDPRNVSPLSAYDVQVSLRNYKKRGKRKRQ